MLKFIGWVLLTVTGWRAVQGPPAEKKYVIVAAPHTSNWDMVYMVAFGAIYGVKFRFLMKHTVFWWPLSWLVTALGGVPVDRRSPHNVVEQMADQFDAADQFVLAVPPEGTRGRVECWKSGFYHIARGAGVPIVLSQLDWSRKQAGFGPLFWPSDDIRADMDIVRAYYADKHGRFPEQSGPIRLREEDYYTAADSAAPCNAAMETDVEPAS